MSQRQRGKMITMKDEQKEISRRDVLIGAGTMAAGAAVLSTGVAGFVSSAKASGMTAYPYKKLNVAEVGKIAHETYFTKFCAETVLTGLFKPLAKSVGAPYDSYPLGSVFWAHGGMMGKRFRLARQSSTMLSHFMPARACRNISRQKDRQRPILKTRASVILPFVIFPSVNGWTKKTLNFSALSGKNVARGCLPTLPCIPHNF
jgi:hypothetical protein